ncbi:MAG: hypothetical protein ACPGWR_19320, partial [Ardenticatenaceae bacterium]
FSFSPKGFVCLAVGFNPVPHKWAGADCNMLLTTTVSLGMITLRIPLGDKDSAFGGKSATLGASS